ncbi:MAG TPA: FAD-dependent oxidoreductase [Polyangiales bacterium]|nr:FAD-dependent oxidoreductase [Polyangiales bacterium]
MSRLNPETFLWPAHAGERTALARHTLHALVIGGGIAGVSAARSLCERGARVTLLEREAALGGRAGGFSKTLATGERVEMERGFHAFFRQYYNLRALLRRIDPLLSMLTPLPDYPILGPEGMLQSFADLPTRPPFQVMALAWRTPYLRARDLPRVGARTALEMLRYDPERTYARWDTTSAAAYLDSLAFPETARRMLFDVFSHSFFNPESELSAAELLMMFHFYFLGNPEGLVFDVANQPLRAAIWRPFEDWLRGHEVAVELGSAAQRIERKPGGGYVVHAGQHRHEADVLVLALDVGALQSLLDASPDLAELHAACRSLRPTRAFAVWRLWLDRQARADRAPFAGTTGIGLLDNISVYERLQGESARWSAEHGGSVIELHAYAVPPGLDEAAIRADLLAGLHAFYPELRGAQVRDEVFLLRDDCPAFDVGSFRERPNAETGSDDLALAGDYVSVPMPCALMERATVSGVLAANRLLAKHGVRPEPLRSVPSRGLLAVPRWRRGRHAA